MTVPLIIYHKNCNDGFAAAWVAWKYFDHEAEFHPATYGNAEQKEPPPDVHDREIFIVDFSYPRQMLEELSRVNNSVIVLDHHKTAAMDLALLPPPPAIMQWEAQRDVARIGTLLAAQFDMARSGAGMTWDYFFPDQPRPHLINYVEDRDIWAFKDPDTRAIHSALCSYPYDFLIWDGISRDMQEPKALLELLAEGQTLDRMHLKLCHEIIEQGRRMQVIGGFEVPVCNAPYAFASDIGNIMCKGYPFAATYFEHGGGITFSLRSSSEGEDASVVAKRFGGGGHRNACGFTLKVGPDGGVTWPT